MPAEPSDESPGAGPYGEAAVPAEGGLPDGYSCHGVRMSL